MATQLDSQNGLTPIVFWFIATQSDSRNGVTPIVFWFIATQTDSPNAFTPLFDSHCVLVYKNSVRQLECYDVLC